MLVLLLTSFALLLSCSLTHSRALLLSCALLISLDLSCAPRALLRTLTLSRTLSHSLALALSPCLSLPYGYSFLSFLVLFSMYVVTCSFSQRPYGSRGYVGNVTRRQMTDSRYS